MAAKRRKTTRLRWPAPAILRRLVALLVGPGRSAALALAAVGVAAGGCFVAWQWLGDDILASDQYQVTAESLDITPLPEWIRSDPRKQVFDSLAIGGPLSIMDDNAARRVADAFSVHPWVERVVSVRPCHPSRIRVELVYRRPVCLVQLMDDPTKALAVDVRGAWLPGNDFGPLEARTYPLVVNVDSRPVEGLGGAWRDRRVVGAAEIAAAFGPAWRELDLDRIMPVGSAEADPQTECTYELFTRRGTRILWGRPPATKAAGEASTEKKISGLRQYAAEQGGLDAAHGRRTIDVRPAEDLQVLADVGSGGKESNRRPNGAP